MKRGKRRREGRFERGRWPDIEQHTFNHLWPGGGSGTGTPLAMLIVISSASIPSIYKRHYGDVYVIFGL